MLKKVSAVSVALLGLVLIGAGCGGAKSSGSSASGEASGASAAFSAAQVEFTAKDKTAAAKTALGADAAQLASFTEYKFPGSSLIVLIGVAADPSNARRLGDTLSESVKAQAGVAGLSYSSVGGLNDKASFAYTLSKDEDSAVKLKALGAISQ